MYIYIYTYLQGRRDLGSADNVPWHATPGPTLFWPVPVGGTKGLQFGSVALPYPHRGIGPRELPSHVSQPTAQPLENQKHDWPLNPVTSPVGLGAGHHLQEGAERAACNIIVCFFQKQRRTSILGFLVW